MKFRIEMTPAAQADLAGLDQTIARRIAAKLRFYAVQTNPLRFAKRLMNSQYGEYRFRVGDYRILFDVSPQGVITILIILRIKHRREVYER